MYLLIFAVLAAGTIGFCCCSTFKEKRNHRRRVMEHKRRFRECLFGRNTENENLKCRTIDVAQEFNEWLRFRDEHRNDRQKVTVKGIFAGAESKGGLAR